jgi:hypothetical protein
MASSERRFGERLLLFPTRHSPLPIRHESRQRKSAGKAGAFDLVTAAVAAEMIGYCIN